MNPMNRPRNVQNKPEPLRPIFEENDLAQAIWIELVPHMVKMAIVEPGVGSTPKVGDFLRVKQFVYLLQKMIIIRQEHMTYTFGRRKLIRGLEYCLAMAREGFKGRFYIDSCFAYGRESNSQIPPNSTLVIDIEVTNISPEPISAGEHDDQQLVAEILAKAKDGDDCARTGHYIEAQRHYENAFSSIQPQRCKDIKNYLYSRAKTSQLISSSKKTEQQISKEITEVAEMYRIFDMIKMKTVEMALINKDYYKVIFLTKQCMLQSRIQSHERVLAPRATAFAEIGELQQGLRIMKHLHDLHPQNKAYQSQLERMRQKEKKLRRYRLESEPVLAVTQPDKKRRKKRERKQWQLHQEQADDEGMRVELEERGLHFIGNLDYFQ